MANRLVFVLTFFILTIVSLVITILTIIFNRTLLKILNFIVISILLIMSVFWICNTSNWSTNCDKLQSFSLNVSANQIISEADAIHNALILFM